MEKLPNKHVVHNAAHWDALLQKDFASESDRACVILGGALLDAALETLLRARLLPCAASEDPLFDGANAPLASFSSRIELSHRIGLIDASFARNLHLIRRIRNDFAHNVTGCSFSDSSVTNRLTELRRSTLILERAKHIRDKHPAGARFDFLVIVSWLQWMLRAAVDRTVAFDDTAPISGEFPVIDWEKVNSPGGSGS